MAQMLWCASQGHNMKYHDLKVLVSNLGWVELGVNVTKSVGCDGTSAGFLKEEAEVITCPLNTSSICL